MKTTENNMPVLNGLSRCALLFCAAIMLANAPCGMADTITTPIGAINISDATYTLSAQAGSFLDGAGEYPLMTSSVPGTISSSGLDRNGNGTARVTVSPAPDPTLSIYGSAGGPYGGVAADAQIAYYFQVVCDPQTTSCTAVVPVDVTAAITTSFLAYGTPPGMDGFASGAMDVVGNEGEAGDSIYATSPSCSSSTIDNECGVDSINTTINVLDMTSASSGPAANYVYMYGTVSGDAAGEGGAESVTVDPIFTIAPAFLAANPGYTLEFSPGIGNTATAPEPSTLSLLLGSVLVAAGIAGRRRLRR